MPKHTPGPWIQGKDHQSIISQHPEAGELSDTERVYYGGKVICETVSGANATLIKAAPDLLKTAELGYQSIRWILEGESLSDPGRAMLKAMLVGLSLAIQKAGGDLDE
jgi:hypothetical protein